MTDNLIEVAHAGHKRAGQMVLGCVICHQECLAEIERLKQDLKRYHPESWARITKRLTDERDEREEAARWLWHRVERPESDKQVIYKRYPWLEE